MIGQFNVLKNMRNTIINKKAKKSVPQYSIFIQDIQENPLEELNNLNDSFDNKENDLKNLIDSFVRSSLLMPKVDRSSSTRR